MASADVEDAVAVRLAGFTPAPVIMPNRMARPPADGSAYVLVTFPVATEAQTSIGAPGANRFREEGAIVFFLHMPRDQGTALKRTIGEPLRALFRNFRAGALQCFEVSPFTANEDLDDEAYFIASASVAYQFDIQA